MPAASWSAELPPSHTIEIRDEELRAQGARLLTPELLIFPVRHHSPGCAWQLRRLFAHHAPSAVLVEGPRSFTPLVPMLTDGEARAPLAVYTYAVQRATADKAESRRAAYYPFCDYSPELVALREAAQRGIPARFIDLDFAEQCLIEPETDDESESLLDERHYRRSQHLQALARKLGCRDHEELWEHLFEIPVFSCPTSEHVARIAAYCHLARMECSQDELLADGTLQREAEMAWHIRQALVERQPDAGPVLVVLGGFHAVVMPDLLGGHGERPAIARGAIADESSALIRYSFDRLDRLNGYSAGMTSPAWHQRMWELMLKPGRAGQEPSPTIRQEGAMTMLFDIALELRERHGLALPMPTLSGAFEHALQLAALRQRPAPVREDVMDAVISCFVKGDMDADGALVRAVAQRVFGGQAMGKVPAGASTPPLVKDFAYRARRQRLKIDDTEPRRAVLDIYRRAEHRVTSRLLHGLVLLGIPFAMRSAGPDFVNGLGLERMQEQWEYCHSAATEAALVEASVFGVTVPLAVANRFAAKLDQMESEGRGRDARSAAGLLTQACVLGLHDHGPRLVANLRSAIGDDSVFDSVVAAAGSIGLLWESREPLEARDLSELPALLKAAYERAIYLGKDLQGAKGDGTPVIEGLAKLRELLVSEAGRRLDAELYWGMVGTLHFNHDRALIRGAAAGLLYAAGRLSERELEVALKGHLDGLIPPGEAVAYLRGLLHTAREAAWQQPALLGAVDDLLRLWDEPAFVAELPELRLAFAEMTPKETDRIAEAVAKLHGATDLGRLVHYALSAEEVQQRLALSGRVREVLESEGLVEWLAS